MTDLIQHAPLTKTAIAARAEELAEEVTAYHEPLEAYVKLRALRDMIDKALGQIESDAMGVAAGEKGGDRLGVKFQVRNGRTMYDFGHDLTWLELKAQEAAAAEFRKQREDMLRNLTEEMIDPATGEFVRPAQITGFAKSALALTFPKE